MAAEYPANIKTFNTKDPGDPIQSAHINELQDEVAAVETQLVTSKLATLTSAPAANKVLTTDGSGNPTWAAPEAKLVLLSSPLQIITISTLESASPVTVDLVTKGLPSGIKAIYLSGQFSVGAGIGDSFMISKGGTTDGDIKVRKNVANAWHGFTGITRVATNNTIVVATEMNKVTSVMGTLFMYWI